MDAPSPENTAPEQRKTVGRPFQPGQSGNPAGRPKGARSKLGEAFIDALLADFNENGIQAIKDMRADKAGDYVKVLASILPKEVDVSGSISLAEALDAIPDD